MSDTAYNPTEGPDEFRFPLPTEDGPGICLGQFDLALQHARKIGFNSWARVQADGSIKEFEGEWSR